MITMPVHAMLQMHIECGFIASTLHVDPAMCTELLNPLHEEVTTGLNQLELIIALMMQLSRGACIRVSK